MLPLVIEIEPQNGEPRKVAFVRSPVRLGRNALNDLQIDEGFVSQWHAVIDFDGQETHFRDLGSTNGTLMDGRRLGREAVSVSTDRPLELTIGSLRLRLTRRAVSETPDIDPGSSSIMAVARRRTMFGSVGDDDAAGELGHATQALDTQNVASILADLKPAYESFRASRNHLADQVRRAVEDMPPAMQPMAIAMIAGRYPELASEPEFDALANACGAKVPGASGMANASRRVVSEFAKLYMPEVAPPNSADDVERLVGRLSLVLEAFARSFVELRKGQEEFTSQIGVGHSKPVTMLTSAESPEAVLAYLLDWRGGGETQVRDLLAAYADIMIHQVALVDGIVQGAKGLLTNRLGPARIEREARASGGLFARIFGARAAWKRYRQQHADLVEETSSLSAALFGREFASAYSAIGAERSDNAGILPGSKG